MDGFRKSLGNSKCTLRVVLVCLIVISNVEGERHGSLGTEVHHLNYDKRSYTVRRAASEELNIFCFAGVKKNLTTAFQTAFIRLWNLKTEDFEAYKGYTPNAVYEEHQKNKFTWFNFPWHSEKIRIPIFNKSCVGVVASKDYTAHLDIISVDCWKVALLGLGIVLFVLAPILSRNTLFHYACGITLGLTTSILIIVFILSKFVPRKAGAMSLLVGGWAIVLYFIHHTRESIELYLQEHKHYVTAYIIGVSIISGAICYRYGPVTDSRTINLIQWALQAVGLIAVFFSSEWQELSAAIVLSVVVAYNFPRHYLLKFQTYWNYHFPSTRKLLTEEDYYEQGRLETRKALEALRKHCGSPECDPWKTINKLKQPSRFASFMAGSSHLSDDEITMHESFQESTWNYEISEDEDH